MSDTIKIILSSSLAFVFGVVLSLLTYLLSRSAKKKEKEEAAVALMFELSSNLAWSKNIFETKNYLRDEAWRHLKNTGYVSYLSSPIPSMVIDSYEKLHQLNHWVHILKEPKDKIPFDDEKATLSKEQFIKISEKLIEAIYDKYPKLRKNFEK